MKFTTTSRLLAAAACAISILGITALPVSAVDKQPIRFLTYDLGKLRAGHYDTATGKFETPVGDDDPAALVDPSQKRVDEEMDLRVVELLKANLPKDQFEGKRNQLAKEETARVFAHYVKLENISRARISKACAVASGLMGQNADFMVDSSEVFYGADKIKGSGPDVTEELIRLDGPQSTLSLPESPKPINVSVGFFSLTRIKDSSPIAKEQVKIATESLASMVAANNVGGALTANAGSAGITGQKLEGLKAQTKAYIESVAQTSKKNASNLSLDTDLRAAAAQIARENDLDVVISTDLLAGKLDLLNGPAFVDVNDRMFSVFDEFANKRKGL